MMFMGGVMATILPSKLLQMASAATAGNGVANAVTSMGVWLGKGFRHYRTLAGTSYSSPIC